MKALTIKEPWASLIVNGYKDYEFRGWKTNFRGKFYIHAGKSIDLKNIDKFKDYKLDYGNGEIIGEAELVDCVLVDKDFYNKNLKDNIVYNHSGFKEQYAFVLKNVKKYDQRMKAQGKLNFWNY